MQKSVTSDFVGQNYLSYEKKYRLRIRFRLRPIINTSSAYLLCRITLNGERCRSDFSTGIKINANQWHSKEQKVKGNGAREINMQLESIKHDLISNFERWKESGQSFTANDLKNSYVEAEKPISLIEIGKILIDRKLLKLASNVLSPATIKSQIVLHKRMTKFFESNDPWPLNDIKSKHFDALKLWCNTQNFKPNTISKTIKYFKEVVKFGMSEGYIANRPINYIVQNPPTKHHSLTKAQLQKLQSLQLNECLQTVADCFLFQCYTGLAYADMAQLTSGHIKSENGKPVIELTRAKSQIAKAGYLCRVPMLPAALRIWNKYNGKLPVISNQKYNVKLKLIGELIGCDFALTSHHGRKTFCTLLANDGVPIEVIAACVGHSSVRETLKTYTRFDACLIERQFAKVGFGM